MQQSEAHERAENDDGCVDDNDCGGGNRANNAPWHKLKNCLIIALAATALGASRVVTMIIEILPTREWAFGLNAVALATFRE